MGTNVSINAGQEEMILAVDLKFAETIINILQKTNVALFEPVIDASGKPADYKLVSEKSAARQEGITLLSQYDDDHKNGLIRRFNNIRETGLPFNGVVKFKNGDVTQWFQVHVTRVQPGILVLRDDITTRKTIEEENSRKTDVLSNVVDILPVGLCLLYPIRDPKGFVTDFAYTLVNKKEEELLFRNDLLGKQFLVEFPDQKDLFDKLTRVMGSGIPATYELFFLEKWFHIDISMSGDSLVCVKRDVTREKKKESTVMELAEALMLKGREVSNLQGEIKTFNTIASNDYHDTLRNLYTCMEFIISNDARNLSNPGKANLRRAQVAIQKMKLLTEDIVSYLDVHAVEENHELVDLNEIIPLITHELQQKIFESNARISSGELPCIKGYRHLLVILLTHLVENAIKFRKEGTDPSIQVTSGKLKGSALEFKEAFTNRDYYVITVTDNGGGFPAQEAEKIFEIFYRHPANSRQKGSGIGLAICKKIMHIHGGFIKAECTPDCTTLRCYFPIP